MNVGMRAPCAARVLASIPRAATVGAWFACIALALVPIMARLFDPLRKVRSLPAGAGVFDSIGLVLDLMGQAVQRAWMLPTIGGLMVLAFGLALVGWTLPWRGWQVLARERRGAALPLLALPLCVAACLWLQFTLPEFGR